MCPDTGTSGDVSAGGIPFYVRHAIVVLGIHEHQIGIQMCLALRLFAFVVEVIEVEIRMLLHADSGDNHESTLG